MTQSYFSVTLPQKSKIFNVLQIPAESCNDLRAIFRLIRHRDTVPYFLSFLRVMFLEIYVRILQGPSPASVSPTGNARWSIGRSVGRSVGWSVGRLFGRSVGRSISRLVGWWSVGRLAGSRLVWESHETCDVSVGSDRYPSAGQSATRLSWQHRAGM